MEKLVELLNEYGNDYYGHNYKRYFEPNRIVWEGCDNSECSDLLIISEKFGFIKRLVEQDKIDFSWEGDLANELVNLFEKKLDNAEGVIALLSISDTPIEDLISYLK